jgi:flavin-dependent dehydrogenase
VPDPQVAGPASELGGRLLNTERNEPVNASSEEFDAVIVGARCAGAATAMLMARAGLRVLVVDRSHPSRDTLSTHALMRAGVLQLSRWGLLPPIVAAGTPPVTTTTFHYGDRSETLQLTEPLYAPRRTVLDTVLLSAAQEAGAQARFGVNVTGLRRDRTGRVTGVLARARGGEVVAFAAPLTIGADGLRSTVARLAAAPTVRRGGAASAILYGYWPSPSTAGYDWFYRPGMSAGIIPTNDGQVCIWAGLPAQRFADEHRRSGHRGALADLFAHVLAQAAPAAAALVARTERLGPLRGFPGVPGYLRRAIGPGWALVGDAGYFKDPLTAHGITDALRDAEFLARAVVDGGPDALAEYERTRDRLSLALLEVAESIAAYRWDLSQIRELLLTESAAMKPEIAALRTLDAPASAQAA